MRRRLLLAGLAAGLFLAARSGHACRRFGPGTPLRSKIQEIRNERGKWWVDTPSQTLPLQGRESAVAHMLVPLKWALAHGTDVILYIHDGTIVGVGQPDTRC